MLRDYLLFSFPNLPRTGTAHPGHDTIRAEADLERVIRKKLKLHPLIKTRQNMDSGHSCHAVALETGTVEKDHTVHCHTFTFFSTDVSIPVAAWRIVYTHTFGEQF